MTTLNDLAQEHLREQRAESQAADAAAYEKEQRRIKRRTSVLHLFKQDILKGAELPRGATIGTRVSNEHGHQITVRFPGNLSIDAAYLYQAVRNELVARGDIRSRQHWIARRPTGFQKTHDDFIDAAIWLLGIELDETPETPQKKAGRPSIIASLIGRGVKDVAHIGPCVAIITDDGLVFDFEADADLKITIRCFCGSPVEVDRPGSYPHLYCPPCGVGWDSVARFLEWKDGGGKAVVFARGGPPAVAEKPAIPALPALLDAAELLCADLPCDPRTYSTLNALDRFRCTCGAFPTEERKRGYLYVCCCENEWTSWDAFSRWKEAK